MCNGRQNREGGQLLESLATRIELDRRLIDVTDIAKEAGIGYRTVVSPAVWEELIARPGPVAGSSPDERLWTLLHSLYVSHRSAPESDEVSCEFGKRSVRAISAPTRVIGVYLGDEGPNSGWYKASEIVPAEIATHIEAVLDYLFEGEREHFESNGGPGHIFSSLVAIRDWLSDAGTSGTSNDECP